MPSLPEQQRRVAGFVATTAEAAPRMAMPVLKHAPMNCFTDEQRLQVYRNNYHLSLRETLAAVYPVVQRLVGKEFFRHLAREYVLCHPSRSGNLHHYGAAFGGFLQDFPGLQALPYLPDVAKLEWFHHQVFHTTDERALRLAALAALDEQATAEMRFILSDACRLLASDYPVLKIWQMNQVGQEPECVSLDEGGVRCVVVRHDQEIEFHALDGGTYALLEALAQGNSFARACGLALAVEAECDIADALQYLVMQKILVDFSLAPTEGQQQGTDTGERG